MAKLGLKQIKSLDQSEKIIHSKKGNKPQCGLCGKTKNLIKTDCCDNWICNDENQYQMFSFARNSCRRNHRRFTLCGGHYDEGHGDSLAETLRERWQDCQECRDKFETEMYVYFGTNEYNFEKLPNPPKYAPTRCVECQRIIKLGTDGYSYDSKGYTCEKCTPY